MGLGHPRQPARSWPSPRWRSRRFSPKSRDSHVTPLDPIGSVLALVGMVVAALRDHRGGRAGLDRQPRPRGLRRRRRVHRRLPGLGVPGRAPHAAARRCSATAASAWPARAITLTFFALFGFYFLSTLYLQYVLGYSPLTAGLAGLPLAAAMIVVAPRSAALGERFGAARVITGGFVAHGGRPRPVHPDRRRHAVPRRRRRLRAARRRLAATAAPATGHAHVRRPARQGRRRLGGERHHPRVRRRPRHRRVRHARRLGLPVQHGPAGTDVPARAAEAADESIGAAWGVAQGLPGGEACWPRPRSAFVDAFRLTNTVSVVVAAPGRRARVDRTAAAAAATPAATRRRRRPSRPFDALTSASRPFEPVPSTPSTPSPEPNRP